MKTKFNLGDEVWIYGLTVRYAGTQHPNSYYLPVKMEIWRIEQEKWWTDNKIHYRYGIKRPDRLKARTKEFRGMKLTTTNYDHGYMCNETDITYNKSEILKKCSEINSRL